MVLLGGIILEIKSSNSLESLIYTDALAIRKEVFVAEQGVSLELELEGEKGPVYFTGYLNELPVATARVSEEKQGVWHIQRVAVKKAYRKQGLASQLLNAIEIKAKANGIHTLTLGAQDQAQTFYKKLGYHVVGAGFLEAGIKHHRMDKTI